MKRTRKRVSVPSLKTQEVFDPKESVLDQSLQQITTRPHEVRGEDVIKPLLQKKEIGLRVYSENSLKPVDIDRELAPIVAQYFHQTHPDLNWGLSN